MHLLSGSAHFHVTELPAYEPGGEGEHLWVEIEKEGLTTDAVAERLAEVTGRSRMDVGYAGRKDRHARTRQWFSVLRGDEDRIAALTISDARASLRVLHISRHRNKLRRGHLRGNRFSLGIGGCDSAAQHDALVASLRELAHGGLPNRFGPQRFGFAGASLEIARAWAEGDYARAVAWVIDPAGEWSLKDPLPDGFRRGPDGRVLGVLRRDANDVRRALHAAGPAWLKMIASAGQSAIFNAVLDARAAAGLLHTLREGDLGRAPSGGGFRVSADALAETNRRAAPGTLDAFATGPLPGRSVFLPDPEIDAQERAWSSEVGIAWDVFAKGGALQSPGERRPLIVTFLEPPELEDAEGVWLSFALPSGSYATEVLSQLGVALPEDRAASLANV